MTRAASLASLVAPSAVALDVAVTDRDDAVRRAGELLVDSGAAEPGYVAAMLEREHAITTFLGEGIAAPHGTLRSRGEVHRDALSVLRLAAPIDWAGERVEVVIGIAAGSEGHIGMLARLASRLLDPAAAADLRAASSVDEVLAALSPRSAG